MSIWGSLSRAIIEEIDVRRATDDPKVGEGHAVIPEGQSSNAGADSHKTPTPGVFLLQNVELIRQCFVLDCRLLNA